MMASYRMPGPMCGTRQPWSLDDGTSARTLGASPGAICFVSPLYPGPDTLALAGDDAAPDLDFLFRMCLSPTRGLSDEDYSNAASTLGVEVAAIKAAAEVETSGDAFDGDGRPRILFERHYFHRLTAGKYDRKHKAISNTASGGYGKFSAQYTKLEEAYNLDPDAALRSASWGRFQIMGNNFRAAGFDSARKFVLAMTRSESEHLKAFTKFVAANPGMVSALRAKNWVAFAAAYNGKQYKQNNYDTKMAEAYNQLKSASSSPTVRLP